MKFSVDEGWWWPLNSKKAHYMVQGRSLCGRWLKLGNSSMLELGNHDSLDNCVTCRRKLAAHKAVNP